MLGKIRSLGIAFLARRQKRLAPLPKQSKTVLSRQSFVQSLHLQKQNAPPRPKDGKSATRKRTEKGYTSPSVQKTGALFISKNACGKNADTPQISVSIPTYEKINYGNDGCDGFAPNFPLIRSPWRRNRTAIIFCLVSFYHKKPDLSTKKEAPSEKSVGATFRENGADRSRAAPPDGSNAWRYPWRPRPPPCTD